jgi:hypothetical protein
MGYIRETELKKGGVRYQAEVRLKGMPKALTAVFDRKNDAKAWISKTEADIRCGRHQLYSEGKAPRNYNLYKSLIFELFFC